MRRISVQERRARLGRRHCLAPEARAPDPAAAADAVVALHATDPSSVFLSAWARTERMSVEDLESALYSERSLVKHLAMRRTLFVFPRDTLAAAQAGASRRVAAAERRRLVRDVERTGLHRDGERWLERAGDAVVAAVAGGREATSTELRTEIPLLEGGILHGEGKSWGGEVPIAPRVLTVLSAEGRIVRASNDGPWTSSRPRWAATEMWLGEELAELPDAEGTAALVERWLRRFGPGTEADLKWWLGGTLGAVRRAVADLGAVEVSLDGGTGFLMPDDLEPPDALTPWAALLPPLDPTTMGWKQRAWYLGEHGAEVFDTNGNGGATAWWDGRIVGGWAQSPGGEVALQLLEDVGREGREELEREAGRLADWLGGKRVLPRFPSPLSKRFASG